MNEEQLLHFDLTIKERDDAVSTILGLLKGLWFTQSPYDDSDVQIYFAHLLFAVALPEYHDLAKPYLCFRSDELLKAVKGTEDRTMRYFIFKVNADRIMIQTAVFENPAYRDNKKHHAELAKLYYDQASSYHKRIYRKITEVGEVLKKVSMHFDLYQHILRDVKKPYLIFMQSFKDKHFKGFVQEVNALEKKMGKEKKINELLDLYNEWDPEDEAHGLKIKDLITDLKDTYDIDAERLVKK